MLLSPRKIGLTSLFKEVRVFKGCVIGGGVVSSVLSPQDHQPNPPPQRIDSQFATFCMLSLWEERLPLTAVIVL